MRVSKRLVHAMAALSCAAVAGCTMRQAASPPPESSSRSVLRLQSGVGRSAWEAIAEERPEFLRARPSTKGAGAPVAPALYLDGTLLDDASTLRDIPASWVVEIRYLDRASAWARFGRLHEGGALMVTTRELSDPIVYLHYGQPGRPGLHRAEPLRHHP